MRRFVLKKGLPQGVEPVVELFSTLYFAFLTLHIGLRTVTQG
jgi:hypothetical protein